MEGGILLYFSGTFYLTHCQSCLFPTHAANRLMFLLVPSALEGHGLPLPQPSLVGISPCHGWAALLMLSLLLAPPAHPAANLAAHSECKDLVLQPYLDL